MRRFAAFPAAALLLATAPAAQEAERDVQAFRDWRVACDNILTCTAIGFQTGDPWEGTGPFLWLRRAGGPDAAPEVIVGLGWSDEAEAVADGQRAVVRVEGPAPVEAPGLTDTEETGARIVRMTDAGAERRLADALAQGERVTVLVEGKPMGAVSLAGSSAALRWMDDRQGRVDNQSALVAKGVRPPSAVPRAPAAPTFRLAAIPAGEDHEPGALPPALAGREDVQACLEDQADPEGDFGKPSASPLSTSEWLWAIPCGRGAYNFTSLYIIAGKDGANARSPGLAGYDDRLTNAGFGAGGLAAFSKGRGLGDCGDIVEFGWNGQTFLLMDRYVMGDCRGVPSTLWPRVHTAKGEQP